LKILKTGSLLAYHQWMDEAERVRHEWYNDSAAYEKCSDDLDELLNKGTE